MRCGARLLACTIATWTPWVQAQGDAAPAAPAAAAAAGPGLRWTVPLAVGGSVAYDLRSDQVRGERAVTQQLLTTNLNAASYIYQPWFLLVNATLGATVGRTQGGEQPGTDRDRFLTGSLRLHLFPRSRFPFEARFEESDSRIDPALGGVLEYRARSVAFSQRYRPEDASFSVIASVEHREQDGELVGQDTQDVLMADFTSRWKRHNFSAAMSRSLNRRHATDERTDFRNVVLRHTLGSGTELSVENSVNWSQTDDELAAGDLSLKLSQWSSVGIWRPADLPLTVTGSARGFKVDASETGLETSTVSVGAGATFEASEHLRLSASVTAQRTDGNTQTGWNGTVGGTYQGDNRKLGDYSHNWYAGVAASRARSSGVTENALSGQIGHGLTRSWGPDDGASWALHANQSASVSRTTGRAPQEGLNDPVSRALAHSLGVTWNHVGADHNAFFRLSLSDARQFDGERAHLQLLNLQLSGTHELDRRRSWTGDLTLQRIFQRSRSLAPATDPSLPPNPFDFDRQITHTVSGEIAYRHTFLFDVPRLTLTSRLRVSHDAQRQAQALVPLPDRESASWENRLDWQIGRLDASLGLRAGRIDDTWRHTLHLRLLRNFGD